MLDRKKRYTNEEQGSVLFLVDRFMLYYSSQLVPQRLLGQVSLCYLVAIVCFERKQCMDVKGGISWQQV